LLLLVQNALDGLDAALGPPRVDAHPQTRGRRAPSAELQVAAAKRRSEWSKKCAWCVCLKKKNTHTDTHTCARNDAENTCLKTERRCGLQRISMACCATYSETVATQRGRAKHVI
jgi:hypothetical protein